MGRDEFKSAVRKEVEDRIAPVNEAVATNVGKKGSRTSVSSRQRVVHRDGETTTVEERVERKQE